MADIQAQMNSILQNPEMMEKIMSMAQSLGDQNQQSGQASPGAEAFPEIDIATIQKLSGFLGQSNIDSNQRTLLTALKPYLQTERITKLEKAMRAAKLATLASSLLSSSGFSLSAGR